MIERNEYAQVYEVKNLQSSLHMSVTSAVAQEISFRIHFFFGRNGIESPFITKVHVPKSTPLYRCEKTGVFVRNASAPLSRKESINQDDNDLSEIHTVVKSAIANGLFKPLKAPLKSKDCDHFTRPPSINGGFTTSDPNRYPTSRKSDTMSVSPFLIKKDMNALSPECRDKIREAFHLGLGVCPNKHNTFSIDENNDYRKELVKQLNEYMGAEYDEDGHPIGAWMSCEAFTILIPLVLSAHRDTLNDRSKGMNSVVQINISVAYEEGMFFDEELDQFVKKHINPDGTFPLSFIAYSRDVNRTSTHHEVQMDRWKRKNDDHLGPIRQLLHLCHYDISSSRSKPVTLEQDSIINLENVELVENEYMKRQEFLLNLIKEERCTSYNYYKTKLLENFNKENLDTYWDVRDSILMQSILQVEDLDDHEREDVANAQKHRDCLAEVGETPNMWTKDKIMDTFFQDCSEQYTFPLQVLREFGPKHVLVHAGKFGVTRCIENSYETYLDAENVVGTKSWRELLLLGEANKQEYFYHDPTRTYQGPCIVVPAGWDKTVSDDFGINEYVFFMSNNDFDN